MRQSQGIMKVIVIGASGTIGNAVVRALSSNHEVVGVTRHTSPSVDIEKLATLTELFDAVTNIDAVVCCAGGAAFKPVTELTDEDFAQSLRSKLLGQVRLIQTALPRVREGGSITVTSGVLAREPIPGSGAVSLVNAGLEGFVRAAALEATRGVRVNVVSPPWVKKTLEQLKMDPSPGMTEDDVAKAYVAAVEGKHQGETLDPRRFV